MRAERIRLCEERGALEREIAEIGQERWLSAHQQAPARSGNVGGRGASIPNTNVLRTKGITQDDQPTVVYSDPDRFASFSSERTKGFQGLHHRNPNDGGYPRPPEVRDRDYYSNSSERPRSDGRGVRNDTSGSNFVPDQLNFGDAGSMGERSARSINTAKFGS